MNEPFPERPTLFAQFVLPSGSKHFPLNLWIADSHVANSISSRGEALNAVRSGPRKQDPPELKFREESQIEGTSSLLSYDVLVLRD
jgi:hypothetical protein